MESKLSMIRVLSGPKGSNPGGFCNYNDGKGIEGYFKYCIGTKIPQQYSYLGPKNQPIYEAITFELARRFGLHTPNFFVLLNRNNSIRFEDPEKFSSHSHANRPFYFFTQKIRETPSPSLDQIGSDIIDKERVYLEGLMIEDILGKRQNYLVLPWKNAFNVHYLDLGCSFVHAVGGFLYLPNELKNYLKNGNSKKDKCTLKGQVVISSDGNSLVDLEQLVKSFKDLTIPTLNPASRTPITNLIGPEELEEIESYLIHGLCDNLSHYKERRVLITH